MTCKDVYDAIMRSDYCGDSCGEEYLTVSALDLSAMLFFIRCMCKGNIIDFEPVDDGSYSSFTILSDVDVDGDVWKRNLEVCRNNPNIDIEEVLWVIIDELCKENPKIDDEILYAISDTPFKDFNKRMQFMIELGVK